MVQPPSRRKFFLSGTLLSFFPLVENAYITALTHFLRPVCDTQVEDGERTFKLQRLLQERERGPGVRQLTPHNSCGLLGMQGLRPGP